MTTVCLYCKDIIKGIPSKCRNCGMTVCDFCLEYVEDLQLCPVCADIFRQRQHTAHKSLQLSKLQGHEIIVRERKYRERNRTCGTN